MPDLPLPASREFKVAQKRIREWFSQKSKLVAESKKKGDKGRKRLAGAGRKIMDEDMEEALIDWIVEMRTNNLSLSNHNPREG